MRAAQCQSTLARHSNATSHYEYDANGNRLVGPGLTASPVYDNQDRLLSYGSCTYAYKNDGSLQTKTCPDGTTTYDYDAFGNLRGVVLPNGAIITYLIDGQNRRVGKKINGTLVEGFLYGSQIQPVSWLNGDGSIRATFVYNPKVHVPSYAIKTGNTYRIITDQVGSVRLVVNVSNGAVAERLDYDEFGIIFADTNPGFLPFGFAGAPRDMDSNLSRMGRRDYDPALGRWQSKEPLRFQATFNFYTYADNEPINVVDVTGKNAIPDACASALDEGRRAAEQIALEILKQMTKCEPLDQGHLKEVKQYQNRLRNALRQVMRFCPDTSTREISNMQFMVDLNIDKELNDLILYDCRCAPR